MARKPSLAAFRRSSAEEKVRALDALRRGLELPAEPLLEEALGDANWRVRKMAVECIRAASDPRPSIPFLVGLLGAEDNAGKRNAAIEALELLGPPAVPRLLPTVGHRDADVRKFAIDTLGVIGDPRSLEALERALDDPDPNVRSAAAQALGQLGDPAAAAPLLERLYGGDLNLDYTILEALGKIDGADVPLATLKQALEHPILRKVSYGLLARCADARAVGWILSGIEQGSRSERDAGVAALVRRYEALHDPRARRALTRKVRERVKLSTLLGLVEGLDDYDLGRKRAAARILGWSARAEAVEPLLLLAEEERLGTEIREALLAVGEAGADVLVEAMPSQPLSVQVVILGVLGHLRHEPARAVVEEALRSESPEVRTEAVEALAALPGDPLPRLFDVLDDEHPEVQRAAVGALGRVAARHRARVLKWIGDPLAEADSVRRRNLVSLMGQVAGPRELPRLTQALRDPDPEVRRAAVSALAHSGRPEALGLLQFAGADESDAVRVAVAHGLARFRERRAVDSLQLLLEDPSTRVRSAALSGLGTVGDARALSRIVPLIRSEDPYLAISAFDAALALARSRPRPVVDAVLDHPNPEVVAYAADVLSRRSGVSFDRVAGVLLDHPSPRVRVRVADLLGELGLKRSRSKVERRLEAERDPDVRDALARARAELRG